MVPVKTLRIPSINVIIIIRIRRPNNQRYPKIHSIPHHHHSLVSRFVNHDYKTQPHHTSMFEGFKGFGTVFQRARRSKQGYERDKKKSRIHRIAGYLHRKEAKKEQNGMEEKGRKQEKKRPRRHQNTQHLKPKPEPNPEPSFLLLGGQWRYWWNLRDRWDIIPPSWSRQFLPLHFLSPSTGAIIGYSVAAAIMWLLYVIAVIVGERKRGRATEAAPPAYRKGNGGMTQYA